MEGAVGRERVLVQDAMQRAEARWQRRLELMQEQLEHQAGEVKALREANEALELALHEVKEELGQQQGQDSVQQGEVQRLQQELQLAWQQSGALRVQVQAVKQAVDQQQRQHAAEVACLQEEAAGTAQQAAEQAASQARKQHGTLQEQLQASQQTVEALTNELGTLVAEQQGRADRAGASVQTEAAAVEEAAIQAEPCSMRQAAVQTDLIPCTLTPPAAALPPAPCCVPSSPAARHAMPGTENMEPLSMLRLELAKAALTPSKALPAMCLASGQQPARCGEVLPSAAPASLPGNLGTWHHSTCLSPRLKIRTTPQTALSNTMAAADAAELEDAFATPKSTLLEDDQLGPFSRAQSPSPGFLAALAAAPRAEQATGEPNAAPGPPPGVPRLDLGALRAPTSLSQDSPSRDSPWSSPHLDSELEALARQLAGAHASTAYSLESLPASDSLPSHGTSPSTMSGVQPSTDIGGSHSRSQYSREAAHAQRPSSTGSSSSMTSLDASLQRLAALTDGFQSSGLYRQRRW